MTVFFCGVFTHPPLREVVLGEAVTVTPGYAAGVREGWADGAMQVSLVPADPGARVAGLCASDLTPEQAARLRFYAEAIGLVGQTVDLTGGAGREAATCFAAPASEACTAWDAAAWQDRDAPLAVATAAEIMAARHTLPAGQIRARLGALQVRASSRLRAMAGAVTEGPGHADPRVQVSALRHPYASFFAVEEYDLRFQRFDGRLSDTITRAAFVSGDAVTVLPYDPVRDRVLLVEQFRMGPYARGDATPWQLEAIAGRIDPGESPEDCARREALEEAGLSLATLHPVASYYPSPGAKTEYLYSFVAIADLPDGAAGVFGMADEAEDIRGHLVGFSTLIEMVATGAVSNAPLILTALWLQREKGRFSP